MLRRAQAELLNPVQRASHAQGWFYSPPESVFADDFAPSQADLEELVSRPPTTENRHDLANWYLVLASHADGYDSIQELTTAALESWDFSLETEGIQLPSHFRIALSSAIKRSVVDGNLESVEAYVDSMTAFEPDALWIQDVVEPGLEYVAQNVRSMLTRAESSSRPAIDCRDLAAATTPMLQLVHAVGGNTSSNYEELVDTVCSFIRSVAIKQHNDHDDTLGAIDILVTAIQLANGEARQRIQADIDNLNGQLRERAFVEHYESLSITPINKAPSLWTYNGCGFRIYGEGDRDEITSSYVTNHYLTLLWIPIFPTGRYRVRSVGESHYQFLGRVPFRTEEKVHLFLGIGAILAVILYFILASNSTASGNASAPTIRPNYYLIPTSSTKSQNAPPNPVNPSVVVPTLAPPVVVRFTATPDARTTDREILRNQIDVNNARLATWSSQIDGLKASMTTLNAQADSVKLQMDNIMARYGNGGRLAEPYFSQYENLRIQFNSIIDRYESARSQQNSLVAQYNAILTQTNQLVTQYNSR